MEQQDGAGGVATAAKEQAGQVGQTAAQAGGQVAQTTKEQAANVVGEAKQQARDLIGEARTQVGDQAGQQKGRAVEGIRSFAGELDEMAQQGGQSGIATEVARQVASRAHTLADHLDRHEPAELLDQVRAYARRRPVAFLAGAAVLGVLAGRLTRNLASSDDSGPAALTSRSGPETRALPAASGAQYGTPAYQEYAAAAAYPAPEATPAYPVAEPTPAYPVDPAPAYPGGGYEPVVADPVQTGYDPGYQAAPEPDYGGGFRPTDEYGTPAPGTTHQPGEAEDREWRNA